MGKEVSAVFSREGNKQIKKKKKGEKDQELKTNKNNFHHFTPGASGRNFLRANTKRLAFFLHFFAHPLALSQTLGGGT